MVQLTTSVAVAVLLAAPSLAAPLRAAPHVVHPGSHLQSREPKIGAALGKARKLITSDRVSAAASVAAAGATIASTRQSARDLEYLEEYFAREPINFGKVFKVAKKVAGGAAHVAAGALSGRDLEQLQELAEREPILGGLVFKAARKAIGVAAGALSGRELEEIELSAREIDALDELATREPIFRAIAKKVKSVFTSEHVGAGAEVVGAGAAVGAAANGQPTARDLEEFEGLAARQQKPPRQPGGSVSSKLKNMFKKQPNPAVSKVAGRDLEQLQEFEELAARQRKPIRTTGKAGSSLPPRGGSKPMKPRGLEVLDLSAREIDELNELAARDPAFRAIAKKVKGLFTSKRVGGAAEAVGIGAAVGGAATQAQPAQRDLNFIEDLIARDFEFDELD